MLTNNNNLSKYRWSSQNIWTLIIYTYFCGFILNLTSDLEFKIFSTLKPEKPSDFFVVTDVASGFEIQIEILKKLVKNFDFCQSEKHLLIQGHCLFMRDFDQYLLWLLSLNNDRFLSCSVYGNAPFLA